jgi:hypothetical protein
MARSGYITGYESVMGAGVKAKTMTSLLIIPALLVKVQFLSSSRICQKSRILFFSLWAGSIIQNLLITIFLTAETVKLQKTMKMTVSKSA